MILPITLAVLIGIAHYISEKFCLVCTRVKTQIISFVAGVSIVYVFLNLYPDFYRAAGFVSPFVLSSVFVGFGLFYLIDKEIYQKISSLRVRQDIRLAHGIGLTVYYFVVGIVLVQLLDASLKGGMLFFVPVFIYAGLSTLSSHGILGMHGPHYLTATHLKLLQSISIVAGTLVALLVAIPQTLAVYFTGLVAGILTYVVLRDMLPKGKEGKPLFFVLGALIYAGFIILLWFV